MVYELGLLIIAREFESNRMPHTSGIVPNVED